MVLLACCKKSVYTRAVSASNIFLLLLIMGPKLSRPSSTPKYSSLDEMSSISINSCVGGCASASKYLQQPSCGANRPSQPTAGNVK